MLTLVSAFAGTLRRLRGLAFTGRRVLVVGPSPTVGDDLAAITRTPSDLILAVNGGIASAPDVDVYITNGRRYTDGPYVDTWSDARRWCHAQMLAQSAGRHVGHLVIFMRDQSEHTTARLAAQGTTWDQATEIGMGDRARIGQWAGITDLDDAYCLSSGVAAACLALMAGADSVVTCGISLSPGHNYMALPEEFAGERRHRTADTVGLRHLLTTAPVSSAQPLEELYAQS